MGPQGEKGLPVFIQDCISNLIQHGLCVEGLFRRSPSSAMLKQVRAAYDRGNPIFLSEYDIHISAVLLKLFLRELPEPIFPIAIYAQLQQQNRADAQKKTTLEFVKTEVVDKVPHNNLILMMEVFRLLKMVADRHEVNKMTTHNLALVMSPNMVRHENVMQEIAMSTVGTREREAVVEGALTLGTVIKFMIEYYEDVF